MDFTLRNYEPGDFAAIQALNEDAVPHVNSLASGALSNLIAQACYLKVAVMGGEVAGFLLAVGEGQDYASLNYRWFSENCEDFIYIDRIVVADAFRGRGIAKALYRDIGGITVNGAQWLACEVNLSPPNPESLSFHHKFGFYEVGQQDTENGKKRVSLLIKTLQADMAPCSLKKVA